MDEITPEHREAAEARLRQLAGRRSDILEIHVVGSGTEHHRHGGREVRIHCQARGVEVVAHRERDDLQLALRDALQAFGHELGRLRGWRTERRVETLAQPPHLGLIDRLFRDEDYGFVLTDAGQQVYFHRNAVSGGLDFDRLVEGQRVGLNIEQGREGLQATVITDVPPDTPSP
jgi:cold shock CspA family protein/ribosome-associated translation inhibitor RaiA